MLRLPVSPRDAGRLEARALNPWLLALLTLVILWAGTSRLVGLDDLLVWHDEVFTLIRVFGFNQDEVAQTLFSGRLLTPEDLLGFQFPDPDHGWLDAWSAFAQHPEHGPLYYVLGRLATALPVDPVTALRGLSASFSVLLIPAVYWLMRELFDRGAVPWVAAVLVACSPLQFLYAQEARQYALWSLLLVSASATLVRALRRDEGRDWALYAVLMTLGCYTHLLFLILIPVHGLYAQLTETSVRPAQYQGWFGPRIRRWGVGVGVTLVLFTPWLWLIVDRRERLAHYTSWMQRPIETLDILTAWTQHLSRAFVDLGPQPGPWWSLLLLPALTWMLWHVMRQGPRPAVWLLLFTTLAYTAIVLGPDLILGGSRSLHVRYALPALLSLQLMAAWAIGNAIGAAPDSWRRRTGLGALAVLIVLGSVSLAAIQGADTWSTKNFSARNGEIARIANQAEHTLVAASESGVATGELVSLAYRLGPRVRILGQARDQVPTLPPDFEAIIALTPSARLREALGPGHPLAPLAGTWQWFAVTPRAAATGSAPRPAAAGAGRAGPTDERSTESRSGPQPGVAR